MSRRTSSGLLLVIVLTGCGLVPIDPPPAAGPQSVTECEPPLAFEGETTIAELGLVDAIPNLGADATRRGTILITQDTVNWEEFAPPGVPPVVPEGQLLCATFEDGTGLATLLHQPFVGLNGAPLADAEATEVPTTPILAGLLVIVLVGVSWLSFRRGAPPRT